MGFAYLIALIGWWWGFTMSGADFQKERKVSEYNAKVENMIASVNYF